MLHLFIFHALFFSYMQMKGCGYLTDSDQSNSNQDSTEYMLIWEFASMAFCQKVSPDIHDLHQMIYITFLKESGGGGASCCADSTEDTYGLRESVLWVTAATCHFPASLHCAAFWVKTQQPRREDTRNSQCREKWNTQYLQCSKLKELPSASALLLGFLQLV